MSLAPDLRTDEAVTPGYLLPASPADLDLWIERAKTEVFTVTLNMTPEIAHRLLDRNAENRPLRKKGANRSVDTYAQAMERGEWTLNGETVVVSNDGHLNDGQHRLHAVVKSEATVPMQVTFGVSRDSRHTVDQGAGRTPGDILALEGERNTNQLAHALQFMWAYAGQRTFNARPSPAQLLETLERHPQLRGAIKEVSPLVTGFRASMGYLAGAYYVTALHDSDKAAAFLHSVSTGLDIHSNESPVFRLRKRLMDHVARREIIPSMEQAALYIKAFNAFIQDRPIRYLAWRRFGQGAEDFPRVGEELRIQGSV